MSYNPDPIFRDELNGYRKSAPPSAWERIESGLEKKRQKSMWLKIAAGLVLLIASSIMFWQYEQADSSMTANSQKTSPATLKIDTIASVVKEQSESMPRQSSVVSREVETESSNSQVIVERSRNNHSNVVPKGLPVVERSRNEHVENLRSSNTQGQNSIVALNTPEEKKTVSIVEAEVEKTNEIPHKVEVSETDRTNITYTAHQVNERFTKQNVVPEATQEKKNASGLKIVIDKALELTNDGTVFGEIREKKNEWLSFNNLSNKTETNK